MQYVPEIIGLIIGALVFSISVTTVVYLENIKKAGQCKDVAQGTRDLLYILNLVAAIVSGLLVVVMIYLWISIAVTSGGGKALPLAPQVRRRLAQLMGRG